MRYSTNLNIIIKAIEKATVRMSRDFIELENLQTNPFSANKFANACYNRVKEVLAEDLLKMRPDYNLLFSDGQKILQKKDAEYSYLVFPIDGFDNLSRANPDFTVAIALEHLDKSGQKTAISVAINKLIGGELYYCEKGFGAYLNNRRLRVSKRNSNNVPLIVAEDQNFLNSEFLEKIQVKKFSPRIYGCRTLEIAYLAASRIEMLVFKKWHSEFAKSFLLLAKEAGGKVFENEKFISASNSLINF